MSNPLLNYKEWDYPYGTIPFEEIKPEHILPAVEEGIRIALLEIEEIKKNSEEPTFENVIVPLETGGRLLGLSYMIFSLLSASSSTRTIREIEPVLQDKIDEFNLLRSSDKELFSKIDAVYKRRGLLGLSAEESKILMDQYDSFIRSGIMLEGEKRKRYEEIVKEINQLLISYEQNVVEEMGKVYSVKSKEELSGLSIKKIESCKKEAESFGLEGYGIRLNPRYIRTEILPFLDSRDLREKLWTKIGNLCIEGSTSNVLITKKVVNLRVELSNLLGYESFSDFKVEKRMAKTKENVLELLNELKDKSILKAKEEVRLVSEFAKSVEGENFVFMPWDFVYYSEKLREKKYFFNEEKVMEYFPLEKVISGVFNLAHKMYGLKFEKLSGIQTWNSDVEVYRVYEENGEHKGLIYFDFFMRPSSEKDNLPRKRGGAWMLDFVSQENNESLNVRPSIQLSMNMKSTSENLLSIDSVQTFLHEFGHCLHAILSNTKYSSVSGTNVYRDFVELPSQLMENFFYENDFFLKEASSHYKTKEPIPEELFEKIKNAKSFNSAYGIIRQLSFGFLDMCFHSMTNSYEGELSDFELRVLKPLDLFPEAEENSFIFTVFTHIFGGGYASGYYSYKWAEVLDADAFEFMKENNFSPEIFNSFRKNILEKGGSEDPSILYKNFRGKEPSLDPLLRRECII